MADAGKTIFRRLFYIFRRPARVTGSAVCKEGKSGLPLTEKNKNGILYEIIVDS